MTTSPGHSDDPLSRTDDRSLGAIVGDIASDLTSIMRSELDLAKTEAKQEVAKAGKGAGMFGGAALSGFFALFFLSLFATYLLANVMAAEWAALIVTGIWAILAAVLAMLGRRQMQSFDPKLERTTKTLKEDAKWPKTRK